VWQRPEFLLPYAAVCNLEYSVRDCSFKPFGEADIEELRRGYRVEWRR
jgi:hypothetical protein